MIRQTTIQVSYELRKDLSELGHKGETYDSIIKRLIKEFKNKK